MFLSFNLKKGDNFETFCDLDDHFYLRHSLSGGQIGLLEIIMVSFLRKNEIIEDARLFPNLARVINHVLERFAISFEAMDRKEKTMMADLNLLSSNQDFIEAVKE